MVPFSHPHKVLPFKDLAKYYDLIYSFKNYQEESQILLKLIKEFKPSKGNKLLDVACGTGGHLIHLNQSFECMGIDYSKHMLKIAKKKIPDIPFKKGNMRNFKLNQEFDVITCLFSSINYLKNDYELRETWKNFFLHLKKGGIAIVEPWFTLPVPQVPHTCYTADLQIAKITLKKIIHQNLIIRFHYLISEKNRKVKYFQDIHRMKLFEVPKMLSIIRAQGFEATYIPGEYPNQGTYIAVKN